MDNKFKEILSSLPSNPGIYKFLDSQDKIIYIGKAKNLKKRVSSYFYKKHDRKKTYVLVKQIRKIEHFVTDTETDALLLENNLIKKHRPRYNVLLKDDKTYPFICIKNEPFPRVFQTRKPLKDGSEYFGPYTSVYMIRTLLDLFKKLFKLRNCNLKLAQKNIESKKFKVCLEYHIGNCNAPCVAKQTEQDYMQHIEQIRHILKGNLKTVIEFIDTRMQQHSAKLEYEKAEEYKKRKDILMQYESRSTVVNAKFRDLDVFNIILDDKYAYVNMLRIANGAIIQIHNAEIKIGIDEDKEDILLFAITDFIHDKSLGFSNAKEIVVPFLLDYPFPNIQITVPKIGDKKKLLDLSLKNLKYFKAECIKNRTLIDPRRHVKRVLQQLQKDLYLEALPEHIECFDNSNIQGTNPVSACVVFKDAKPAKKDYRKFHIKTVHQADDFASMYEVVFRRYSRLKNEQQNLPQLIIIDGGKGQLNAAYKAICELNLQNSVAIIGIAKRLEEIFLPGEKIPLYLNKNSESLKIIQHARNEAHRFSLSFHRQKRSGKFIKSELETIAGIGEKTIVKLLKHFETPANIKKASEEQLAKVVGKSRAKIIRTYFSLLQG